MKAVRRHSWWVWVILITVGWMALTFLAPKVQQYAPWVAARPAIYAPR